MAALDGNLIYDIQQLGDLVAWIGCLSNTIQLSQRLKTREQRENSDSL